MKSWLSFTVGLVGLVCTVTVVNGQTYRESLGRYMDSLWSWTKETYKYERIARASKDSRIWTDIQFDSLKIVFGYTVSSCGKHDWSCTTFRLTNSYTEWCVELPKKPTVPKYRPIVAVSTKKIARKGERVVEKTEIAVGKPEGKENRTLIILWYRGKRLDSVKKYDLLRKR